MPSWYAALLVSHRECPHSMLRVWYHIENALIVYFSIGHAGPPLPNAAPLLAANLLPAIGKLVAVLLLHGVLLLRLVRSLPVPITARSHDAKGTSPRFLSLCPTLLMHHIYLCSHSVPCYWSCVGYILFG
jgi:hypothetical protein